MLLWRCSKCFYCKRAAVANAAKRCYLKKVPSRSAGSLPSISVTSKSCSFICDSKLASQSAGLYTPLPISPPLIGRDTCSSVYTGGFSSTIRKLVGACGVLSGTCTNALATLHIAAMHINDCTDCMINRKTTYSKAAFRRSENSVSKHLTNRLSSHGHVSHFAVGAQFAFVACLLQLC